jgi:hypothetical protein
MIRAVIFPVFRELEACQFKKLPRLVPRQRPGTVVPAKLAAHAGIVARLLGVNAADGFATWIAANGYLKGARNFADVFVSPLKERDYVLEIELLDGVLEIILMHPHRRANDVLHADSMPLAITVRMEMAIVFRPSHDTLVVFSKIVFLRWIDSIEQKEELGDSGK